MHGQPHGLAIGLGLGHEPYLTAEPHGLDVGEGFLVALLGEGGLIGHVGLGLGVSLGGHLLGLELLGQLGLALHAGELVSGCRLELLLLGDDGLLACVGPGQGFLLPLLTEGDGGLFLSGLGLCFLECLAGLDGIDVAEGLWISGLGFGDHDMYGLDGLRVSPLGLYVKLR